MAKYDNQFWKNIQSEQINVTRVSDWVIVV
jgi:hypothetical protein